MRAPAAQWRVLVIGHAVVLLSLLASCGNASKPLHELAGSTMGTTFSVKVVALPAEFDPEALQIEIEHVLGAVNRSMSTYLPDSELSKFNASRDTAWFRVSDELCDVVEGAQSINELTGGAFDITVGLLVNLWGFGPDGAVSVPPEEHRIRELMRATGHDKLHTDCALPALKKDIPELHVDLSAYAKGYAVDRLAHLLDAHNQTNYLVEIGGELRARGMNAKGKPWAIAIETPARSGRSVRKIIGLDNAALATSGDYRNYFEYENQYFSHTIDPRTGRPVSHNAASVTVLADTAAFADAIATGLLVLGPTDGFEIAERQKIAAYFLLRVGTEIEERMTTIFASQVYGT